MCADLRRDVALQKLPETVNFLGSCQNLFLYTRFVNCILTWATALNRNLFFWASLFHAWLPSACSRVVEGQVQETSYNLASSRCSMAYVCQPPNPHTQGMTRSKKLRHIPEATRKICKFGGGVISAAGVYYTYIYVYCTYTILSRGLRGWLGLGYLYSLKSRVQWGIWVGNIDTTKEERYSASLEATPASMSQR